MTAPESTPTTLELETLFESLKNWGRWGPDDQRGALNHLRPEHLVAAAGLVRLGETISLARDLPVRPAADAPFPAHHHMLAAGDEARCNSGIPGYEASRDYVGTDVHGLGVSHVDALCHMFVQGLMYNGFPASDVRSDGARTNTVMALAAGVVGRGVLLDIAAVRGVPTIDAREPVRLAELLAAEERQAVRVGTGDILLISCGRDALRSRPGGLNPMRDGMAGLHPDCLAFLREREISVLGSDGISDPMPGLGIPQWPFPVHQIGIVAIGLHLIDNMDLGELAERCAGAGRWEFLFAMNSLRIPGGTGCPVNPTAVL